MELYQEVQNRTGQTVAVVNTHVPGLAIGGKTAAQLLAQANALDGLAQARNDALFASDEATREEFRAFQLIRLLVLKAPALIESQLGDAHPVADSLDKVYAITPRNTEGAVARARALLPVWRKADAARAAARPTPLPAIERNGLGVADLEALLADHPALEQAVEDADSNVKTTRAALLAGAVAVDGFNKRFYKALKAQADPGSALEAALSQITTETPDLPETLGIRSVLQGGGDGLRVLVGYENGTGEGATERLIEWQVGGTGAGELFAQAAPADPSGNALGPFKVGDTVRLRTRVRNANGTRTGSVRTITLAAPVA